jgi:hypothetical protein
VTGAFNHALIFDPVLYLIIRRAFAGHVSMVFQTIPRKQVSALCCAQQRLISSLQRGILKHCAIVVFSLAVRPFAH